MSDGCGRSSAVHCGRGRHEAVSQRRPFLRCIPSRICLNFNTASSCSSIRPSDANTSCSPCGDESTRCLKSKAKSLTSASSSRSLSSYCPRFGSCEIELHSGLALLTPQAVEIDNHKDQAAGDDPLPKWIHIQQVGTVI